jgi:hypothetical protein
MRLRVNQRAHQRRIYLSRLSNNACYSTHKPVTSPGVRMAFAN